MVAQPTPITTTPWSTRAGAAEYGGCTERTIDRLIQSGELPAYRFGSKSIRIKRADLDKLFVPIAADGAA